MHPTDTSNPDYFHKVVDCQWACPAHTNVPEYIRLIAQGRYTDAYMLDRESNVLPAILGRTCAERIANRLVPHSKLEPVLYPTLFTDPEQVRISNEQCDFPGGMLS